MELSEKLFIFVSTKEFDIMTDTERKQKQAELKSLKRQIADKKLDKDIAKAKETLRIANMSSDQIRIELGKKSKDNSKKKDFGDKYIGFMDSRPTKGQNRVFTAIALLIAIPLFILIIQL